MSEAARLLSFGDPPRRRAYKDPVLFEDSKVLDNLLNTEEHFQPSCSYFKYVQTEIQEYMREIVAYWLLEVCEEQQCEEEVFPLSINYMDRVLTSLDIHKNQLQLLATTCLFIASKLKETIPLSVEKLCMYTDNSITPDELLNCEILVLSKLKWDVAAITPYDFFDQLLCRLGLGRERTDLIRRHAQTFICLCSTDFSFCTQPPSMIAAGCILAAFSGLENHHSSFISSTSPSSKLRFYPIITSQTPQKSRSRSSQVLLNTLHKLTQSDVDCLRSCQEQIERLLVKNLAAISQPAHSGDEPSPSAQCAESEHCSSLPNTPTDIQDVVAKFA